MKIDKLTEAVDIFSSELKKQLEMDYLRWGDEWKIRPRANQEFRIYERFNHYLNKFVDNNEPIPWLKIAGLALIAWVRENGKEYGGETVETDAG